MLDMKSWIKLSKSENDNFRVLCFPYSGGTAQVYRPLTNLLPDGVSVYSYELPGRGRRFGEEIPGMLSGLVEDAFSSIRGLIERPYAFLGHSLGGIIAFEMTRHLRKQGQPLPKHLFVSGIRAPQVPKREGEAFNLPRQAFIEKIKDMGGTPSEILENEEMLDIMIPVLRKDFQIYETYSYSQDVPMPIPITAFGGRGDNFVTEDDIRQWSEHTSSLFDMQIFAGDHFFILDNMNNVAQSIARAIFRMNQR
jgi:medium-chain acyl-[acyl-carrier-protein] hydrolase